MTAIKRDGLDRALARWDPAQRLLLLAGPDESASRELALKALAALADSADPMAVTDLAATALAGDPGLLADEAASVAMFGGARAIRVMGAGEACTEAVRLLLAAPVAGNVVVMTAGDLGRASGLRKLVEGAANALLLLNYPLDLREAGRWIAGEARARGLTLEEGVASALQAATGGEQGVLLRELEKYALYLDADPARPQRLTRAHLAALGADSADEDMTLLVNALTRGDATAVERQLAMMSGSSPIPAIRAIARRLLVLAEVAAAVAAGQQPQMAVKALRPPLFWKEQEQVAAAVAHWPRRRIAAGLAQMLAAEAAIKTPNAAGDALGWQAILALAVRP